MRSNRQGRTYNVHTHRCKIIESANVGSCRTLKKNNNCVTVPIKHIHIPIWTS